MKLYLYGCGKRCKVLLNALSYDDLGFTICGLIDSNPDKQGTECYGYKVFSPEILKEDDSVFVCVTFYSPNIEEPLWDKLHNNYGVRKDHIFSYMMLIRAVYEKIMNVGSFRDDRKERLFCFEASWDMKLGGVESWLRYIGTGFPKYSNRRILFFGKESNIGNNLKADFIHIVLDDFPEFRLETIYKCIDSIIQTMPCTIVFSRVSELLLAASILKKSYPDSIHMVMTVHGMNDGQIKDVFAFDDVIDRYVVVATSIKEKLKKLSVSDSRIDIMTCPVVFQNNGVQSHYNMKGKLHIGYAGRLEVWQKRVDLLLDLAERLIQKQIDFELSIAGEGSYKDKLEEYIKENSLEKNIILCGQLNRKKIQYFWNSNDIALNVSESEGRPISNLEAMYCGAVPVVTNTGGILDDVHDGENGFVVPIGNMDLLVERICFLNEHRTVLNNMSIRAEKEAREKCNLKKHIEFWNELFETVNKC